MVKGCVHRKWENPPFQVWSEAWGDGFESYIPVVVLPAEKVQEVKKLLDSIIVLACEGPEVERHTKLFPTISREANKALAILEGE